MASGQMQTDGKQICSRGGTSVNYGETCKERFNSLRSASLEVVCSRPFAPQLCLQIKSQNCPKAIF